MKLIHLANVFLASGYGASAKLVVPHDNRNNPPAGGRSVSITGLRALHNLPRSSSRGGNDSTKRHLEDFGFGEMNICSGGSTTTCDDDVLCDSFQTLLDLEASCNGGCIPDFALSACDMLCSHNPNAAVTWSSSTGGSSGTSSGSSSSSSSSASGFGSVSSAEVSEAAPATTPVDAATATTSNAITPEKRIGLFGYGTSAGDLICGNCKFYRCCVGGDDGNEEVASATNVVVDALDTVFGRYDVCRRLFPRTSASSMSSTGSWGPGGVSDSIPNLPENLDGLWDGESLPEPTPGDDASGPGSTETASGMSVLGMVADSFECPCSDDNLCSAVFAHDADRSVVAKACDARCLPKAKSCEQYCSESGLLAFPMACEACEFLACCADEDNASTFDEVCAKILPAMAFSDHSGEDHAMDSDSGSGVIIDSVGGDGPDENFEGLGGASGLLVLSEFVSGLACPNSCPDRAACLSFFASMREGTKARALLEETCDSGCAPTTTLASCDDFCGNRNGAEHSESVVDVACDSCKFLECCGAGDKFEVCEVHLPDSMGLSFDLGQVEHGHVEYSEATEAGDEGTQEAAAAHSGGGGADVPTDADTVVDGGTAAEEAREDVSAKPVGEAETLSGNGKGDLDGGSTTAGDPEPSGETPTGGGDAVAMEEEADSGPNMTSGVSLYVALASITALGFVFA